MTTATEFECPYCNGKGHYDGMHRWSDGWGMVTYQCTLCNATGKLSRPVHVIAHDALKRAGKAEAELDKIRNDCALYFSILDTGKPPNPPLQRAPRPALDLLCWETYLREAGKRAARARPSNKQTVGG